MKIKPFKLLGKILLGAAPVIAGVVAGPGAGVIVAGVMGAAGLTKKAGKVIEEKGIPDLLEPGHRPHKMAAPAVAVGLPLLLAPLIPQEIMDQIQGVACQICDNPMAIVGIVLVFWHSMVGNLQKLGGQAKG